MSVPSLARFKVCTKCGIFFPFEMFGRASKHSTGRASSCKCCEKRRNEARREQRVEYSRAYYAANREQMLADMRERYQRNPEPTKQRSREWLQNNREAANAQKRRYRKRRPEVGAKSGRKYRLANAETVRERQRKKRRENLDKGAAHTQNYFARKRSAEGKHTADEIWQMYEDQQGLCAYCETPLFGSYHVDHMIPLSREGRNDWTNLAVSCGRCNDRKGAKTVEEWIEWERAIA